MPELNISGPVKTQLVHTLNSEEKKKNKQNRKKLDSNTAIPFFFFFDSLRMGEEERKKVFIWKCFYNVMSSKHKGLNLLT